MLHVRACACACALAQGTVETLGVEADLDKFLAASALFGKSPHNLNSTAAVRLYTSAKGPAWEVKVARTFDAHEVAGRANAATEFKGDAEGERNAIVAHQKKSEAMRAEFEKKEVYAAPLASRLLTVAVPDDMEDAAELKATAEALKAQLECAASLCSRAPPPMAAAPARSRTHLQAD